MKGYFIAVLFLKSIKRVSLLSTDQKVPGLNPGGVTDNQAVIQ